jgi:hypothetical protein
VAYYIGDIPVEDIVIAPARSGEPIPLDPFNTVDSEVQWRDGTGAIVPAEFLLAFATGGGEDDMIVIEWPDTTPFETAGIYSLSVILGTNDGHRERLAPAYFIAQDDDGWHTVDSVRQEWTGGAPADDRRLYQVLDMARQQVLEYAPELAVDAPIPSNYREGQLAQARNLYNAGTVDSSGGEGSGDFVLRPFPLDWMVKQMLRPQRAIGAIG